MKKSNKDVEESPSIRLSRIYPCYHCCRLSRKSLIYYSIDNENRIDAIYICNSSNTNSLFILNNSRNILV